MTMASVLRSFGRTLRLMLPGALLLLVTIGYFGCTTYEARYTDASGARCLSFQLGHHEADICHGRDDRPGPMPPSWPADWTPGVGQ